ncbi:MAG: hypothetical protein ACOYIF_11820, partial [Acetivibrionales bacterium]
MKTVGMSWEDCADYWKKDVYNKNVKPLFDAFREAEKAIALVEETEGIGSLEISLTLDEIEELDEKRKKLASFCDEIHYEISQMVDNPFTARIAELLEAAYALDPSDFKAETSGTTYNHTISLKDLMMATTIDEQLKKDFDSKFNTLDHDKPSKDLKDAIREARFLEEKKIMQSIIMLSQIDFAENFDKIIKASRDFFSSLYDKAIDTLSNLGELINGNQKAEKEDINQEYIGEINNPEDLPGYEQEKSVLQALEKIKMSLPEDGSIHFSELRENELELIGYTMGLSKADIEDINNLLQKIEAWRINHGLDNPKEGLYRIDRALLESIQKELREEIKEREEYREKVYNLYIEMHARYEELLEKAKTGSYWQEFERSPDGILYGQKPEYIFNLEKENPDALRLRYKEFLPKQMLEAGFNFTGIEQLTDRDTTLKEYVNTMGPIWQLMQEYRTIDDDLRDISLLLVILSAFAAPISLASGGAKA